MRFRKKTMRCYTAYENKNMAEIFLFLMGEGSGPEEISLEEAFLDRENLGICFWIPGRQLVLSPEEADKIREQIKSILLGSNTTKRGIFWLCDGKEAIAENMIMLGLLTEKTGEETAFTYGNCQFPVAGNLFMEIKSYAKIKIAEDKVDLSHTHSWDNVYEFVPGLKKGDYNIYDCGILFQEGCCGSLVFNMDIKMSEFVKELTPGLEYSYVSEGKEENVYSPLYLMKEKEPKDFLLSLYVIINPCDICNEQGQPTGQMSDYNNHRTVLNVINKKFDTPFPTAFSTIYGETVYLDFVKEEDSLYPSRFTFSKTKQEKHHRLCPEGEFYLYGTEGTKEIALLCGRNGTEYLILQKGEKIRFLSGQNAHAPAVEGRAFQVGEDYDANASNLTNAYRTSWIGVSEGKYVSEPPGFALYGMEQEHMSKILVHQPPFIQLDETKNGICFPMMPYLQALVRDKQKLEIFEDHILANMRQKQIEKCGCERYIRRNSNSLEDTTIVTPSGFLANMEGIRFRNIRLTNGEGEDGICFCNPTEELVRVFQSPSLCLVAVNPEYLGSMDDTNPACFHNLCRIQDWIFRAQVGYDCKYGSYGGVMIIKGCKGKLFDPDDLKEKKKKQGLISCIDAWTYRSKFSSPITNAGSKGDMSQQPLLMKWIENYFKDAYEQTDHEYFSQFCDVITDENWQGVLFLRLPLEAENMPAQMAGLLSGAANAEKLCVHHLGITLNTISVENGQIKQDKNSSLFGLICYRDTILGQGKVEAVLPKDFGNEEFRLLELKVLFRDSAVVKQSCKAQISFARLFGSSVKAMKDGNPYRALLLEGHYQLRDGAEVFLLQNKETGTFELDSNILKVVRVTDVEMISPTFDCTRFELSGSLHFHTVPVISDSEIMIDLFSFGEESKSGLIFSHAELEMKRKENVQEFTFFAGSTQFDLLKSEPGIHSLCSQLHLQLLGMVDGNISGWQEDGYAKVMPCVRFSEEGEGSWIGLEWKAELGSLGELAGKAGLKSRLLLAWNTASNGDSIRAFMGIKMPGTGKTEDFFLQNILRLSIGSVRLEYDKENQSFILMLNEVAVKAFGIGKLPPNGNISFYLFGSGEEISEKGVGWYGFYHTEKGKGVE
ncbi:MAG: hypothetical protein E7B11_22665 [Clostridiales bacterium]|nr:hypothetical protein [Clostridiales bacterium]MDU3243365.1 hypothetical protein [Clostridiales bacterium]